MAIKKATSPRFIGTELPVDHVIWLGNNKILAVERDMSARRAKARSISAIYNITTGEKLLEREWNSDITFSKISPDGHLWLAEESANQYKGKIYTIVDLKDFSTTATIPQNISQHSYFIWRNTRQLHGTSYTLKKNSKGIENRIESRSLWQFDEKSGRFWFVRTLNDDSNTILKSPTKKWAIKEITGAKISRTKIVSYYKTKLSFAPSTYSIVSLPDMKTITKLPNESRSNMRWSKDSNVLWSAVHLKGSQGRTDILRYDLKKRAMTSVKLKNTSDVLAPYNLNDMPGQFSPDCRLWCACSQRGIKWAFWNTETGELVKTIGSVPEGIDSYSPDLSPSFSDDSRYFFCTTKNGIEIYETSRFLP